MMPAIYGVSWYDLRGQLVQDHLRLLTIRSLVITKWH